MDQELFDVLESALQEALDTGSRGNATVYTAAGMAWHLGQKLQTLESEDE